MKILKRIWYRIKLYYFLWKMRKQVNSLATFIGGELNPVLDETCNALYLLSKNMEDMESK
jgi:hypothetical protein